MKIKAAAVAVMVSLIIGNSLIRAQTLTQPQAQAILSQIQSLKAADDLSTMVQAVETTTPAPASSLPYGGRVGTFYSAQFLSWPPLPGNLNQLPVWDLGDSIYLLADENFNYDPTVIAPQMGTSKSGGVGMMTMDVSGPPTPPGGGGTNSGGISPHGVSAPVNYGTNLWIAMFSMATNNLTGIASNTLSDVTYAVQTNSDLTTTNWAIMGYILGSEVTNWTPLNAVPPGLTNNLFFRLQSWVDSTGTGIPDWWWLKYFGQITNVDPNADPMGDGWNNLQKFQNAWNPNVAYPPPTPEGFTANYNPTNGMATFTWQPSPAPVSGYTLQLTDYSTGLTNYYYFAAGTNSFQVTIDDAPYDPVNYGPSILVDSQIRAAYSTNNSPWSGSVWLQNGDNENISSVVSVVPGPQGGAILVINQQLPQSVVKVRVTKYDNEILLFHTSLNPIVTNYDIPVGSFTNGIFQLPTDLIAPQTDAYGFAVYNWWAETIDSSGNVNVLGYLASPGYGANSYFVSENGATNWLVAPYFDGRAQLKQNLRFLLRTPYAQSPFYYIEDNSNQTETLGSFASTTNYAYASFNDFTPMLYGESAGFNVYSPFEENYRYRDFIFNLTNADTSGNLTTGVTAYSPYDGPLVLLDPSTFQTPMPATNGTGVAAVLATNITRWVATSSYPSEFGVAQSFDANDNLFYSMTNGTPNYFGLPYISTEIAWGNTSGATQILQAGQTVENVDGVFYPEVAQPQFLTEEYDFWNPALDELPGTSAFSTANTSRQMFAAVGSQIQIAGYAKLAVTNSIYSALGVYGYLGQYFNQVNTNGNATTNATGILSSYGDFLATQPGTAALVTMPDPETGAQGTCMVSCVSLVLDKNHDGTMDTRFNGPDATSSSSPMEFWINNDYDFSSGSADPYGHDIENDYRGNYQDPAVACPRDLEDFARLWICGMPPLPTSQGYTVTLSMFALNGSPAINLVNAAETNGGTLYLTDTNTALLQSADYMGDGFGQKYRTITTTSALTLPSNLFTNGGNKYFLFEGAGIGEGELTMTIADSNGKTVVQASTFLDIHDIKDFYERATITNVLSGISTTNWYGTIASVQQAVVPNSMGVGTNLIVFVHGFNTEDWKWRNSSETAYKRLYWSAYQGKFMTVKWPCLAGDPLFFDPSELDAYKASTAFVTYLNQLRSRFPGYRLNLLVHSQGNSFASEAIKKGAPFDTYILAQGAVAASCYDINAPTASSLLAAEVGHPTPDWQPMGYHGAYTNLPGRLINYCNPLDFVLETGTILGIPTNWKSSQALKPDNDYGSDGTNVWEYVSGAPNMPITDPDASRAFVARSRTSAIGAQGLASGETRQGVIGTTIDLNASLGFGNTKADHSGEFTKPIQTCGPFYLQVLNSIEP